MECPIHIDTINMELSILYFTGLLVIYLLMMKIVLILANSAVPGVMTPYAAFHQFSVFACCLCLPVLGVNGRCWTQAYRMKKNESPPLGLQTPRQGHPTTWHLHSQYISNLSFRGQVALTL